SVPVRAQAATPHGEVDRQEQKSGCDDGGHAAAQAVQAVHEIGGVAAEDDDRDHADAADTNDDDVKQLLRDSRKAEFGLQDAIQEDQARSGDFGSYVIDEKQQGRKDLSGDFNRRAKPPDVVPEAQQDNDAGSDDDAELDDQVL